jgi:uncharacterized membrane protein YoaK (UPF0700 family)
MIHSENVAEVYSKENIPLWLISAFKAGFLNTVGFLFAGKFVSHVTGFGTQVGIALGHEEYFFGAELLIIPIAFILGGVTTSFVLDREYTGDQTPPYWIVQGLITVLLIVLLSLGYAGYFPENLPFDSDENYSFMEFFFIGLLCYICGLKNSLVTWASWGRIRVTHLTGLSTDIGLNLIRTFFKGQVSPRFKEERHVNILRMTTFLLFSAGAALSALIIPKFGYKVLFLPIIISAGMSYISILDSKKRQSIFVQEFNEL